MVKFTLALLASSTVLMGALGAPISTDSLEGRSDSLEAREPRKIAVGGGRINPHPAFRPFTRPILGGPGSIRSHGTSRIPIRVTPHRFGQIRRQRREETEDLEAREPYKIAVGGGRISTHPNFRPFRRPILSGPGSIRSHSPARAPLRISRPSFGTFGRVKREEVEDFSAREFEDQEARDLDMDELEEVVERSFDNLD
ncbi:hypothetical protein CPB83DRAFT_394937 [Crepidotus variabilis]|uniref:Uncharacterized protein n=1 Tax=Crepidotus variabilis TaxID=179855 RepID=A0A9P6EE80_9AGAR|nr:hypothetical protein CPB83DRAFT_394937 [Crepidotus variabilis]